MALEKNEKILIGIASLMTAFIIIYNLFFIPEVPLFDSQNHTQEDFNENENIMQIPVEDTKTNEPQKYKININLAAAEELSDELDGIGPAIANRIVDYREKNGGFHNIEEIVNVKGIGDKIFEKIKNYIIV
ncbi:MAG: helix-hairpin-helix domain-containing protein [Oscillospiraceae bacterium]|nr:helix-hairpin-helix domain-containing protein [Oscillospiraceae bacterium]